MNLGFRECLGNWFRGLGTGVYLGQGFRAEGLVFACDFGSELLGTRQPSKVRPLYSKRSNDFQSVKIQSIGHHLATAMHYPANQHHELPHPHTRPDPHGHSCRIPRTVAQWQVGEVESAPEDQRSDFECGI